MIDKYIVALTGFVGYIIISYYSFEKIIINTKGNISNLINNLVLLISTLLLSIYYYNLVVNNINDVNNSNQRHIKIFGHFLYVVNILMILIPQTDTVIQIFDIFGFIGHSLLVYSAYNYSSNIPGIIQLILYFTFKIYHYFNKNRLMTFCYILLLINYISLFIIDYFISDDSKLKE